MFRPSRKTQPYRAALPRHPGPALTAMTRGRTSGGYNPADITRSVRMLSGAPKMRAKRPPRPPRPKRPQR